MLFTLSELYDYMTRKTIKMENLTCYEHTANKTVTHYVGKIFYTSDPLPAPPPISEPFANRQLTLVVNNRSPETRVPKRRAS